MNFADLKYAKFNNAGLKGANLNLQPGTFRPEQCVLDGVI